MTKRILVLHTGGTISMQADTTGKVITNEHNPMNHVAVPLEGIQVTALDVFNIPSPHITPQHMLQLYQKIKTDGKHFDGVVITHGTDTLEETFREMEKKLETEVCVVYEATGVYHRVLKKVLEDNNISAVVF